jgi:Glycosyl transferase family 2
VIAAVGVVVPAHNEEVLLTACLAALTRAAARISHCPVHIVVVADACSDRTAEQARAWGTTLIEIDARNVGAARATGMSELLRLTAQVPRRDVWLATTDADTVVPAHWLQRQLAYADLGWDAVLGTVTVSEWPGQPPHLPAVFATHYAHGHGPHPHVHGANLGIRASAYIAAGGFKMLPTAEDHALLRALTETGCQPLRASDLAVTTSGRRIARAPLGFSHLLSTLATPLSAPVHPDQALRPKAARDLVGRSNVCGCGLSGHGAQRTESGDCGADD